MSASSDAVIDASTLAAYILTEENHEGIYMALRARLEGGGRLFTPDIAQLETANALWKAHVLRGLVTKEFISEGLSDLFTLPIEAERHDEALTRRAVEISLESGLSVYDSIYVSLAEREKAELLTSDKRQHEQAKRYVTTMLT